MSFEPSQAARAAVTSHIEQARQEAQTRIFAKRIAEGLGVQAELLGDNMTWGVRLPKANLHFYGRQVTCYTDRGRSSMQLLITEGASLYETADGERCVIFDETEEDGKRLLTVTASGHVTYDSDASGVSFPQHLVGGRMLQRRGL